MTIFKLIQLSTNLLKPLISFLHNIFLDMDVPGSDLLILVHGSWLTRREYFNNKSVFRTFHTFHSCIQSILISLCLTDALICWLCSDEVHNYGHATDYKKGIFQRQICIPNISRFSLMHPIYVKSMSRKLTNESIRVTTFFYRTYGHEWRRKLYQNKQIDMHSLDSQWCYRTKETH